MHLPRQLLVGPLSPLATRSQLTPDAEESGGITLSIKHTYSDGKTVEQPLNALDTKAILSQVSLGGIPNPTHIPSDLPGLLSLNIATRGDDKSNPDYTSLRFPKDAPRPSNFSIPATSNGAKFVIWAVFGFFPLGMLAMVLIDINRRLKASRRIPRSWRAAGWLMFVRRKGKVDDPDGDLEAGGPGDDGQKEKKGKPVNGQQPEPGNRDESYPKDDADMDIGKGKGKEKMVTPSPSPATMASAHFVSEDSAAVVSTGLPSERCSGTTARESAAPTSTNAQSGALCGDGGLTSAASCSTAKATMGSSSASATGGGSIGFDPVSGGRMSLFGDNKAKVEGD